MINVKKIIIVIIILIALPIAYILISPLFITTEVNEDISEIKAPVENQESAASGAFVGLDNHNASGTAQIIKSDQGNYMRFQEDFEVTNGPDLYVYLGSNNQYDKDARLARLKGSKGSQNYEIPDSIDVSQYNEVWVWCRAFSVPFGKAVLQ